MAFENKIKILYDYMFQLFNSSYLSLSLSRIMYTLPIWF